MNQRKGENIGMNAALELEDLVANPIKDSAECILAEVENTDNIIKFYRSEEITHENRRNEIEEDKKKIYLDSSKTFEVDDIVNQK
ncbi:hypothetical protein F8M41_008161 [Gigaspora margarita]|uniref:Uncharacterized protein n=1 Tax=Gigaspora margarita TaxID=4874 RepID=A0A8H3X403_GIGMA|nr:hypothetical protein F8M41_008161 [Gigaspora margarita]